MTDTSRESIEQTVAVLRNVYDPFDYEVADELSALLDKCDAAIARAEKAEAALEAARIEGCKWGIEAALDDQCLHMDPTRIVKEHGK